MAGRTVQVRVGGQVYRLVTSASDDEIHRLETIVNDKLAEIVPRGRPLPPNALLLAAMSLAHDLEEARAQVATTTGRAREALGRMLHRVDEALLEVNARSHAEEPGDDAP
jgi:cell division protein ZapA